MRPKTVLIYTILIFVLLITPFLGFEMLQHYSFNKGPAAKPSQVKNTGSPDNIRQDNTVHENALQDNTVHENVLQDNTVPINTNNTGNNVKIPVLMYHAVNNKTFGNAELFVKPSEFYRQMKYMADNGYTPLLFDEVKDCDRYRKPVIITFDDGYRNNYINAYPILKQFNFKATIFLIADSINHPAYLTSTQIKKMESLISFQSHTLSHPQLDKMSGEKIEKEYIRSMEIIKGITGKPVYVLAYPYGAYNDNVIAKAAKYFSYGVTVDKGFYRKGDNNYTIRRIYIIRSDSRADFINKILGKASK